MKTLVGFQLVYAMIGLTGHFAGVPDVVMFVGWSILGLSQRLIIRKIATSYPWSQARPGKLAAKNETART